MNQVNDLGNTADDKAPDALADDFQAMMGRINELELLSRKPKVGADLKSLGNEVERVMRGLGSHYPFTFSDYSKTAQWVRDAQILRDKVKFIVAENASTLRSLLEVVRPSGSPVAALDNSIFTRIPPLARLTTFKELGHFPALAEADNFVIAVFRLGDIPDDTKKLLDERQSYVKGTDVKTTFAHFGLPARARDLRPLVRDRPGRRYWLGEG